MKDVNITELMKEMESTTEIDIEHVVKDYYMREYKNACILFKRVEKDGEVNYSTVGYYPTKDDLLRSIKKAK